MKRIFIGERSGCWEIPALAHRVLHQCGECAVVMRNVLKVEALTKARTDSDRRTEKGQLQAGITSGHRILSTSASAPTRTLPETVS